MTLLESRGRLGGAAYSFTRDGIRADNGQHVFLRCCTEYRALISELEADDLVTLQPRLEIPVLAPGGRRAWLRRSGLPAPLHLAGSLLRYPYLSVRERVGGGAGDAEAARGRHRGPVRTTGARSASGCARTDRAPPRSRPSGA